VDDSSQRRFQGAGIGLALVREFTELLGGSVSVRSEVGKGSRFTVRLPYRLAESASPGQSIQDAPVPPSATHEPLAGDEWLANLYRRAELFPAQSAPQTVLPMPEFASADTRPTVLVADDEPDMRGFLKSQLARTYRVIEAADGQQAVEKALYLRPEVVLLDMMMPELNGVEACRELRGHAETRSIPIIMLTARADDETKLEALSAGANDYLTKPFVVAELEARVRNLAESARHERAIAGQKKALEEALTKLKETETELVQTEKMASLGRLSAGIIHEINNPLNFAATGLFTLRSKARHLAPEQQAEYAEILHDVEEGLNRVKTIVSDLRAFAHRENVQTEPVNIAEAIDSALRFLSHEWKDRIRIVNQLPAGLVVSANRNKLIQVLVNLVENSVDALTHKAFADDGPTIWIEGRTGEGKTMVSIRDNGDGIEPENLNKIFDPFFTTKDVGEGMGLGLSICYRIVQEYQGRISVRSERGRFCEFTLEFPAARDTILIAQTA
jgi:signal transduction histidine kinase